MPDKNGRKKCENRQGRPCNDGHKGGKNKRGGCGQPAGRPCGSKNKTKAKKK